MAMDIEFINMTKPHGEKGQTLGLRRCKFPLLRAGICLFYS
jgi:hypothetical protein